MDLFSELSLGVSDNEADEEANIVSEGISQYSSLLEPSSDTSADDLDLTSVITSSKAESSIKAPRRMKKVSRWANKCMYAELLEMHDGTTEIPLLMNGFDDGIPDDLETGYIAIAPIPIGKRCLLVTQQSSGVSGSGMIFH